MELVLNNTRSGEVVDINKEETFVFSLDCINDATAFDIADRQFEYIGNRTGSRTWQYKGKLIDFKVLLEQVKLQIGGGFRSETWWNDGDWIFVSLKYCP